MKFQRHSRDFPYNAPMNRRLFIRSMLSMGSALLPGVGCGRSKGLRLGIHPWIGYESLYLAKELGWLPHQVFLHEGASVGGSLLGLKNGELDGACLTLDEMLRLRAEGLPLVVVLVFNISAGADVLLTHEPMKALSELKGQRIGVETSSVGALMLHKVLEMASLEESDVKVVDLSPSQQEIAWKNRSIDAAVTYEPYASRLRKLGAHNLVDTRQIPETIFDVLAIREDRLENRQKAVRSTLEAHFHSLEHIRINRQDALYRIAAREKIGFETAQQMLSGVALPSLTGNHEYLSHDSALLKMMSEICTLHSIKPEDGKFPGSLSSLLDPRFLPRE